MSLNNLGVVVERDLLAAHNDVDTIGIPRGVKADMVKNNFEVRANWKLVTRFTFSRIRTSKTSG